MIKTTSGCILQQIKLQYDQWRQVTFCKCSLEPTIYSAIQHYKINTIVILIHDKHQKLSTMLNVAHLINGGVEFSVQAAV